jgi:tetratricopeptide (TPR) repeat protein
MAAMAAELLTAFQQSDRSAQAREAHLTRLVIIQLARRIAEDVSDFDTALAELDRAVTIAIDVQKDPARYGNVSAVVREVLSRMASLSGEGRHDEAADLATREFANWERAEQDRQDAARQQGLALLEAGLKQDILRRDADAAAARIERMVQLQSMTDALSGALREAAVEWMERGRDQGLNFDLAVAIALARRLIRLSSGPDQSGDAQNLLGSALQTLGERESGTGRLKAAVATFRAALQERARERVPLEWAATQNNLGTALATLGARESGTMQLEEAAMAFSAALEEYNRERFPLDWAMTQNNLGNALSTLGARENGTGRLEEAVAAYREALEVRTRERMPLHWAMTQNNLGTALATLGERESGTMRLEEAVMAFCAALEEYNSERVPLDWAMTQNNLGNALSTLGTRESGTGRLEEAVAAYRAALGEYTRERVPLDWAASTGGLARARALIARRTGDCALAREAVAALEEVLAVVQAAEHGPYLSYFATVLTMARAVVAKVCG